MQGRQRTTEDRKRWLLRVAVMAVLALLVASCSASTTPEDDAATGSEDGGDSEAANDDGQGDDDGVEAEKRSVVMAIAQDLTALDPMNGQFVTMGVIAENVSEGLVAMDGETSELQPVLAESWELIDDTTWRFNLREGVEFHNGEPFNAEAVQYSMERMQDESFGFQHAGEFAGVSGISVIDDFTIEFTTDGPVPELPRSMVFLMIVPPEYTASGPDAINDNPVGTGPYVYESGNESEAVFVANENYWGGAPALDQVTVISRPEDAARVAALEAGEVDIAWALPAERVEDVPNVVSAPTLENNALILNGEFGIMMDGRVREALAIGIDVETIRESLFGDQVSTSAKCQWYPEGVFGYNDQLEPPSYDPDAAKRLIDEAGVAGETVGIAVPIGRIPGGEDFAQAVGPYLEEMGLVPDIQIKEYQAWIENDVLGPDDAPAQIDILFAGINSFTGSASRPFNTIVRDGARVERFPHTEHPEIQPLLDEAVQTLDEEDRLALFQELGAEICDSNGFVFLYNFATLWGTGEGVSFAPRFDERIVFDSITLGG